MPEWEELWIKTGQRGLLIVSYKRLKKKKKKKEKEKHADRAIILVAETVHVLVQLALLGSP